MNDPWNETSDAPAQKLYNHHLFKNKHYSHYNQLSMTHGKIKSFLVKTLLLPGVILLSIGNILWFLWLQSSVHLNFAFLARKER